MWVGLNVSWVIRKTLLSVDMRPENEKAPEKEPRKPQIQDPSQTQACLVQETREPNAAGVC